MAPNFAITNHHVINARLESEADASEVDFKLQAESATLWFDFDAPEIDGLRTETKGLVTASRSLNYALLELVSPGDRLVPRIAPSIVAPDSTSRMAVNIVQHRRRAQAGRIPEQPGERRRRHHHSLFRRH
jgi:endonuclease G, mitochondrial